MRSGSPWLDGTSAEPLQSGLDRAIIYLRYPARGAYGDEPCQVQEALLGG
jgi:hypothetical protein